MSSGKSDSKTALGSQRFPKDDIPDEELDQLASLGFDRLWVLGVWQTGEAGRKVSRENPEWQDEFSHTLPDLAESDICGSCFAIGEYHLGGTGLLCLGHNTPWTFVNLDFC